MIEGPLTFEEWSASDLYAEVSIKAGETGADLDACFDAEDFAEREYEDYVRKELLTLRCACCGTAYPNHETECIWYE